MTALEMLIGRGQNAGRVDDDGRATDDVPGAATLVGAAGRSVHRIDVEPLAVDARRGDVAVVTLDVAVEV